MAIPHINLYYTDQPTGNDHILPHTCFYMLTPTSQEKSYETARFCLSQSSSSYKIEKQQSFPKFTFDQLAKQNITSEQLYFWSAPMDLIERYQLYLNQLSNKTGDLSSAKDEYYNCTLPKFGPQCQYTFIYDVSLYTTVEESIIDYYRTFFPDTMTSLTCYTHLKCNRTSSFICLDWREICDEKIDCFDSGLDEVDCWQLQVNECEENEFRCRNGQCIPRSFQEDYQKESYCIDYSDLPPYTQESILQRCFKQYFPSFRCDDISDAKKYFHDITYPKKNLPDTRRTKLAMQMLYSNPNPFLSNNCSLAFQCLLKLSNSDSCCRHQKCIEIVDNSCPDVIYFPNARILSTNIYFIYKINDSANWLNRFIPPFYICYNESNYDLYFKNYSRIVINNMTCIYSRSLIDRSFSSSHTTIDLHTEVIDQLREILREYNFNLNYNSSICNRSNMYQCVDSDKCISIYLLMDRNLDCPYRGDDEDATITIIHTKIKGTWLFFE